MKRKLVFLFFVFFIGLLFSACAAVSVGLKVAEVVSTGATIVDGAYQASKLVPGPSSKNKELVLTSKTAVASKTKSDCGKNAPDRIVKISDRNEVWEYDNYPSDGWIKYFAFIGDSLDKTGYRTTNPSDLRKFYIETNPSYSFLLREETDEAKQTLPAQPQTSIPSGIKPISFK
jgi:hypothetical protein